MKKYIIPFVTIFVLIFPAFRSNAQNIVIPLDTSYNLTGALKNIRNHYPNVQLASAQIPDRIRVNKNLVYATLENTPYGKRDLHLDIFRPTKKGKYPALIQIHGGGWRSGNKSMEAAMAISIAQAGYVTIPVEYRLSMEAKYPAALHDIKAAIRWVKANADTYGIDTTRIAITGNSAGGHLASLVGMTNSVDRFEGAEGCLSTSSKVHAVIDIDGVLDFMAPLSLNLNRKPDSPDIVWLGGSFQERPDLWKEASPIFWVNEKSVPTLFVNSAQHRFHAGEDEMLGLLKQFNIYTDVCEIPDSPHTFWLFHPWFDPTVNHMVSFLDKVFKNK
jgi:Esterase/lipase